MKSSHTIFNWLNSIAFLNIICLCYFENDCRIDSTENCVTRYQNERSLERKFHNLNHTWTSCFNLSNVCSLIYHYCRNTHIFFRKSFVVFMLQYAKGHLISKCPFGVKTSSKKTNNFFSRISALVSKKRSNQKSSQRVNAGGL